MVIGRVAWTGGALQMLMHLAGALHYNAVATTKINLKNLF